MPDSSDHFPSQRAAAGQRLSAAIGIARVMCLLGIVYVHAWTGLGGSALTALNDTAQGMMRWALMDLLGRSAVPLLGMISGWLVAGSLRRRPWRAFMTGKIRTILAPMILWNAMAILLVSGAAAAGWIKAPMPTTWRWTIDELFCLFTPDDINVQMSFLRDLFICMAAAPLIIRLPGPALLLVVAGALCWTITGFAFPLLLRPAILLFFLVGIIARRADAAERMGATPILYVALPYVALALMKIWFETLGGGYAAAHPLADMTLDVAMRFVTALFFWAIAWRLAASKAAAPILRVEPYVFLMFCSHLIMIWLGGPLIGRLTGPMGSPFYPFFLIVQPGLVLLAALGLGGMLMRLSPTAALLLSGGRLRAADNGQAAPIMVAMPGRH